MRLMFSPGASAMRSGALAIGGPKTQEARRASSRLLLSDLRLQRIDVIGGHLPDRHYLAVRDLP